MTRIHRAIWKVGAKPEEMQPVKMRAGRLEGPILEVVVTNDHAGSRFDIARSELHLGYSQDQPHVALGDANTVPVVP